MRLFILPIIVLAYLVLLVSTTLVYQQDNPDIWNSTVRRLRWSTGRQSLRTPPASPVMFRKRGDPLPGVTYAPQPVRPIPGSVFIHHDRGGLGSEYEIERYKSPPNSRMPAPEQMNVEVRDSLPEAVQIPPSGQAHVVAPRLLPRPPQRPPSPPAPAVVRSAGLPLYPIYNSFTTRGELPSTVSYANRLDAQPVQPSVAPSHPTPLGDWPRRDIMEQPVKRKRQTHDTISRGNRAPYHTQRTATAGVTPAGAGHPGREAPSSAQLPVDDSRARRPSGPRLRIPSSDLAVPSQRRAPL